MIDEMAVGTIDLDGMWTSAQASLEGEVGEVHRAWLRQTRPVGFSGDTVVLAAPHNFAREQLELRLGEPLRRALSAAAGRPLTVVVTVAVVEGPLATLPETPVEPPLVGRANAGAGAADALGPAADTVLREAVGPSVGPSVGPFEHPGASDGGAGGGAGLHTHPYAGRDGDPRGGTHGDPRGDPGDPRSGPGTEAGPDGRAVAPRLRAGRAPQRRSAAAPETFRVPSGGPSLNPKYTFERFVIGDGNRFAHAAAFAVSEAPAMAYNPLFVYGDAGLGKTHLLQAAGHYAFSLYPQLKVRYVTTEQFTNEFIEAISSKRHGAFQRRFRDVDVLLVDDVQFLTGKERTQEEFFHTFNALHNAEKQIVLTSDKPPKQVPQLEDRLRTRFEWGLIVDVQPPDLETRLAILQKRSAADGIPVGHDVLMFIAERVASNIRELEGAFIRVAAFASLQKTEVTLQLAQMVLKDVLPDGGDSEISIQLIMSETANYHGLSLDELCSASRTRTLVAARQVAMYLARELTELSLPAIGSAFGGRDHTTVLHAQRKIADLMGEREGIYAQVQELTSRIKASAKASARAGR